MNRLGFAPGEAKGALERLQALGRGEVDHAHDPLRHRRWSRRRRRGDAPLRSGHRGHRPARAASPTPPRSSRTRAAHADTVREGIALYGATPFADRSARKPGTRAGDDAHLAAHRRPGPASRRDASATAPPSAPSARCASASSPAAMRTAIRATRPPARRSWWTACARGPSGRVSMDMITVDLTPVPAAHASARRSMLWGEGCRSTRWRSRPGTVGYELMCALAPRVPVGEVA